MRLSGVESLNQLFEYQLILQTPDALSLSLDLESNYPVQTWIGKELSCSIELEGTGSFVSGALGMTGFPNAGAGTREISGLVTDARFVGLESRHALYEVTIRPWLYLATLTSDCKIFQNLTPVEVIEQVLSEYSFLLDKRLIEEYPKRDYTVQYNETDFEFVSRLLQEWGVNFHFEHSDGIHHLVLSDHNAAFSPNTSSAYHQIAYHPPGHKIDQEYLHAFSPAEQITSGAYASREYDYTQPRSALEASDQQPRDTGHNQLEIYRWRNADQGSDYNQPNAGSDKAANQTEGQGKFLARLRMQALRQTGNRAQGEGNVRGLAAGHTFKLKEHPRQSANIEYLTLKTTFEIENVSEDTTRNLASIFPISLNDAQRQLGLWQIRTKIEIQPTTEAIRPEQTQRKPRVAGTEVALVTGPTADTAQGNLYTDDYGRIKIQFPWDRYGNKDQNSSCWVRVSSPWAGNQLGQINLPRIGQEVLITFIGGDPDQPVCTGRVHNQLNLPPWQLPDQQALSGIRSRELTHNGGGNSASGRSNHLVLDDTADHIQLQLKSDHQSSSLSLGDIARIDNNAGRQDLRGEGFELRTDAKGAIRANGLLISTEPRASAVEHITSMTETAQRLEQSQSQHQNSSEFAQQAQAQESGDQDETAKALKTQQQEIKGSHKNEDGRFPEFETPQLVIASPAGIASTTPKTTHLHSGEHTAITTGEHLSHSAGKNWLATVHNAIRFVAAKGIRLFSTQGKVQIQAQSDNVEIIAQKVMELISNADWIEIKGKQGVRIHGANSVLEVSDIVQFLSKNPTLIHGNLEALAPQSVPFMSMDKQAYNEMFVLKDQHGEPVPDMPYKIKTADGRTIYGRTNARGEAMRMGTGEAVKHVKFILDDQA